jgi:hypothetical protein
MHDLVGTLLKSTRDYVGSRIQSQVNREAYLCQMDTIIGKHTRLVEATGTDLDFDLSLVLLRGDVEEGQYKGYRLHDPRKYRLMAYENALDIVRSIHKRFISGGQGEGVYFPLKKKNPPQFKKTGWLS